jgi:molecular chaperone DnaK
VTPDSPHRHAYYLGVDLGTTFTAAAVWRDGRVDITNLGNRAATVPSVVLLRDDGSTLVGEAAERRAAVEPHRVAREFKRRLGDPTPIVIGGAPYSADALTAKVLRWVVAKVSETEGAPPAGLAVSHPANWGAYKLDLLGQAIARADLDRVATVSEPEAAAIHYASQERVEPGSVVAVYDLGGGTFDTAVLRKTGSGWEILGEPQGVERLGGVDLDEAVFQHVVGALDGAVEQLDPDEPASMAAMARLRAECVAGKEALSADTDVSVPVFLPTVQTEVRLTRRELETMVRPVLEDSIAALERALKTADLSAGDVGTVLLVGGSSRVPLVAQMVGSALGRPVAVDAHPKYSVALGAAIVAAGQDDAGAAEVSQVTAIPEPMALATVAPPAPPAPLTRPAPPAPRLPLAPAPPAPAMRGAPVGGAPPGRTRSALRVWAVAFLVVAAVVGYMVADATLWDGSGGGSGAGVGSGSGSERTTTTRMPSDQLRALADSCEGGSLADCDRLWEFSANLVWRRDPAETCGGRDPAGGHEGTCVQDFG